MITYTTTTFELQGLDANGQWVNIYGDEDYNFDTLSTRYRTIKPLLDPGTKLRLQRIDAVHQVETTRQTIDLSALER